MSTVMEDLKLLEDRSLARIRELEAGAAELEQWREVAAGGPSSTSARAAL